MSNINARPMKPCGKPGCRNLGTGYYCKEHQAERDQQKSLTNDFYDKTKRDNESTQFYHSKEWRRLRDHIRERDRGLCQRCIKKKKLTRGKIADHIVPLKEDWSRRLDESNIQLLCHECHNKKTWADKRRGRK